MDRYTRVIPRDLFNEANLLKCYGQLWLRLEGRREAGLVHDDEAFEIAQDPADGSLSIRNVQLEVGHEPVRLFRPLNARSPWPLMAEVGEEEAIAVFNPDGSLSVEMLDLIERIPRSGRKS